MTTDAKGHAELSVDLPDAASTRPLEAKLIVDVGEPGGRTVERTITLPVRAKGVAVGVKPDFDSSISAGDQATFQAIAVAPDGTRVARKARPMVALSDHQRLPMVQQRRTLELRAGQVVEADRRAASIDIGADAPAEDLRRPSSGARTASTSRRSTARRRASRSTSAGRATASADTPDNAVVTLDKTAYAPGDEAKLRISSPYAGKATVALVGDMVERFIDVDLVAGDNVVPFAVGADWGPGAYAVALTHRPLDVKARRMPGRAIGLAWFAIDRDAHKLDVAFGAPALTKPREPLERADRGRGTRAGRGGACHRLGGRPRHPQPHRLQDAGSGLVSSSASASCRSRSATSGAC